MHDAERIYRLHQRLRDAKHPIAKARLAEELEVSPRTIQREVEFLRLAYKPKKAMAGKYITAQQR